MIASGGWMMLLTHLHLIDESELSIEEMAVYLRQHDWSEISGKHDRLRIFEWKKRSFYSNPVFLVLPRGNQDRYADLRLVEAVELLAHLDKCSFEEMLAKVQGFVEDKVSGLIDRSISLVLSPELEAQLAAKARSEKKELGETAAELLAWALNFDDLQSSIIAIQQGFDDFAAGRSQSFHSFVEEQRTKHGLSIGFGKNKDIGL
jgi:hypothetical protein